MSASLASDVFDPCVLALTGLAALDRVRRGRGVWLDRLGLGPLPTPSWVLWTGAGARLLVYDTPADGPGLLIVPAPIKRAYIWDLIPEVSVVGRCLAAGLRVYMLEWTDPAPSARGGFGLVACVESVVVAALNAVAAAIGEHRRVVLAGHSLGGTLAAIAAALCPERVLGLVLIEAPLRFDGARAGALAPLIAATPSTAVAALGRKVCVPGSLLSLAAVAAAPDAFVGERYLDRVVSSLSAADLALHLRVERWTHDELAMPGRLFADIVESLYRADGFADGILSAGDGRPIDPRALAAVPVLAVVDPRSRVVPPGAVLDLLTALPVLDLQVLAHGGETGIALRHVGMLVGRIAHRKLWPRILAWIAARRP